PGGVAYLRRLPVPARLVVFARQPDDAAGHNADHARDAGPVRRPLADVGLLPAVPAADRHAGEGRGLAGGLPLRPDAARRADLDGVPPRRVPAVAEPGTVELGGLGRVRSGL